MAEQNPELTPLQKAALAMKVLRARVDELEQAASAPIAVVGLGCRFPAGSNNPDQFWEAVRSGRDGSIEVPADRWDIDSLYDPTPGVAGKMYVRNSCFIDGVDQFDPLFFRISPREAIGIDPQQRLLLEVVWEALEDAGIAAPSLVGSKTGVFLGISTNDYSALLARTAHGSSSNASAGAGNAASVASGRISYTFGFQGPCVAIDTACSSSLVAAHLAVQAIRNGECGLALVAGVNLMLSPEITVNFSLGRMLSPDGHCKTFDASADGYVRGEGCGVLVLKKLSDALAAGDRVHAVIRGSSINQDGRSAGLTAPNGLAQEAVIKQALANAKLTPDAVDYIEAHGTGTSLGDPIEMHALKGVFGKVSGKQRERPLYVGSVKTNIGHAEAASGVAGLIKTVLMLRHQAMPPHLNFKKLNPHIDLSGIDIRIPLQGSAMPIAVAGVSSFGFSGTNAHIVLEAPPQTAQAATVTSASPVASATASQLFLSARTKTALQALIARYQTLLANPACRFEDVCHTAAVGRAKLAWWVLVNSPGQLAKAIPSNAPPPALPAMPGRRVALPSYPFERERYWVDASPALDHAPLIQIAAGAHPLLGRKLRLPQSQQVRFESAISSSIPGLEFLEEHRVNDQAVMPATCFIEIALAAHPDRDIVELRIPAPLLVHGDGHRLVQTICEADGSFRIVSYAPDEENGESVIHATGRAEPRATAQVASSVPPLPGNASPFDVPLLYQAMERLGVRHGPAFRLLSAVSRADGVAHGALAEAHSPSHFLWAALHPAALDAALQLVAAALPDAGDKQLLPTRFGRIRALRKPVAPVTVRGSARREGAGVRAEILVEDAHGVAIHISDLQFEGAQTSSAASDPRAGMYRLDWVPRPLLDGLSAPHFLPGVSALVSALTTESERLGVQHDMASYAQAGDALEGIATAYVVQALRKLGLDFQVGTQLTFGALAESLGIDEQHHRLLTRMLGMLEQDGVLLKRGRLWQVAVTPAPVDIAAEIASLTTRFPNMAGEIGMVRRCGSALAEVLTNRTDPLGLLFPADEEGAGVFYQTSAYAHTVNGLLFDAASRIAASLPPGRALRVLEVGGGTGGATGAILDGLTNAQSSVSYSYTFTDLSPAFLNEALKKFPERHLAPRLLDIERDPAAQGFVPRSYDLIIAANVLHATRDIRQSLTHVHSLLADGGALLLVESTAPRRWVDILFGLTGGWWRFEDTDLRPSHPLLSHASWRDVLRSSGFEADENAANEVIVARRTISQTEKIAGPGWYVGGVDTYGLRSALEQAGQRSASQNEAAHWVINVGPIEASAQAQSALLQNLIELVQVALAQYETPALTLIASDALGHAGLSGFVRSLAIEQPTLKPRLLIDPPGAASLVDELVAGAGEPEVRWTEGKRQVARIAAQAAEDFAPTQIAGSWLISGGFGGLGLEIARWLAAQGARRIILLGRHKPAALPLMPPGASGIIEAHEGDVADEALLARILESITDLEGVVHAAGALADAPVLEQHEHTINAVLHPKIAGALALDRAVRGKPIKHFVLFASAAGIVGSANQVNHGFGSSFLDALAHARRRQGLPGLSLDWGVWSSVGAAARKGFDAQAEQLGLGSITPQQGSAALGAALGAKAAQLVVLPSVDWRRFTGHLGALCSPLYELVLKEIETAPEAKAEPASTARTALSRNDAADALARVVGALLSLPRDFDHEIPLAELGLDSLVAVEIKNQVLRELGVEISVRELIEGATLSDLASRVADSVAQEAPAEQAAIKPDLANRYLPFPLTDMQQAFWVGRRADLALGGVNCYLYTEFDTRMVDVDRLERAWNTMIRRHDMLRVVIQDDGMQRILPEAPLYRFEVCDLRQRPDAQVQDELARLRSTLAKRLTPPGVWPLFDLRVTKFDDLTRLHIGFDLIALDAASIFALRQELGQLYDDPSTELPPIGLSFRDYVLHLEAARTSPEWRHSEQYWKARALSLPDAPDLPLAAQLAPEPGAKNAPPEFKRHLVRVDPDSTDALRRHAQARGLTLPSVLAATYADVLAMWSRSAQFCLTVTLFNRPPLHPDMGSLMGDFTSTLLLEVDARAASFTDRALTLMRRMASDIDHADLNGIQVLREVARQTGQGLRTIPVVFTSTLGFRRPGPVEKVASEGTLWDRLGTTVYNVSSTPQIWIDHQISEEDGNLLCHWDVLQGVFPSGVVDQMMIAYRKILDGLVDGAGWDKPVSAADLPSAARTPLQLVAPVECLHAAFERQAAQTPNRTALITADTVLDYATLHLAAAHLAANLSTQLGGHEAARDRLVAVCFPKGWRQIVAVLAILKAGAAYLPVDPSLPAERRKLLIEQGEALTLDDEKLLDAVLAAARAKTPAPALPAMDDSTRLAYVIYTSGSTGMPKGVMIEHAAALTTVREINRRWKVGAEDRVLGLSSLSFDLSVYDIFGPLSVGGALVLPEPEAARDPSRWSTLLCEHKVTVWNTVPALMAMQVEYGLPAAHALRLVMMSGDWVPLELVARLKQLAPKATLVALGGATEAAIWSNAHEIGALDPAWPSIPYGQPLAGHQLHVVNSHGEPSPDWAIGQIEISGQGLASGYWRDPARTAERFRIDKSTGERRYVTGDLGRFRPYHTDDATTVPIEFLGREDSQIKLQGHRIELGEIEAALESHPQVAGAVATVYSPGKSQSRSLHAFFVPKQQVSALAADASDDAAGTDWNALVQAGKQAAARGAELIDAATFKAVADVTAAHAISAAAAALRGMAGPGQPLDWRTLISTSGVAPRYQNWLKRMLPLVEKTAQSTAPVSMAGIVELDRFGFGAEDFALLGEVASKLPEILTERMHSSDIYLSRQTPEVYAKLFAGPNALIADVLQHVANNCSSSQPISILEVGGGLGTTLAAIAPALPGDRIRYHFTDVSPHMVRRARETFGALPWLSFGTLDFDQPTPDGDASRYDVIIASSALHAATDVRRTLSHLQSRLSPGGTLIVLEQTRFFPWFDLSMGLQAGFDSRTDHALRPDHPLLSREVWNDVMREAEFADVCALVAEDSLADRLGVDVFLARAPGSPVSGTQLRLQDGGALAGELSAWLQQRLPAYMVPKTIDRIAQIPLSANGKVDRARLERLLRERDAAAGMDGNRKNEQRSAQAGMEQAIATLVRELLPDAGDATERSLFDLGATSLTLVSLHRLISEKLGRVMPLQAMFEQPTIASLARALAEVPNAKATSATVTESAAPEESSQELQSDPQSQAAWAEARDAIRHASETVEHHVGTSQSTSHAHDASPFVSFDRRPGNTELRPTLIMMPGVLALPFYLRGLAAALAPDVALTTMQFPGMFDDQKPLDSVEAQAEYAVKHLRQFQPSGPYLLAGHSYGGYVAIEMARRLRDAGEAVPLLILGDSVRTHSTLDAFQSDEVAYVAMTRALYALYGAHLARPYEKVKQLGARAGFDVTAAAVEAAGLFGTMGLPFERMAAIFKANFKALGAYRPAAIPGDVTVVRTEGGYPPEFHDYESGDSLNDPGLGWTELVLGKLEVHRMPGDHLSMQDDANMTVFAEILRKLVLAIDAGRLRERQW
ncbi:hypothetical protein BH11PSE11_BH11PSE11_34670 [soil metagenome]